MCYFVLTLLCFVLSRELEKESNIIVCEVFPRAIFVSLIKLGIQAFVERYSAKIHIVDLKAISR